MYTVYKHDSDTSENITMYEQTQLQSLWYSAPIVFHITCIFLDKLTCQLCDNIFA